MNEILPNIHCEEMSVLPIDTQREACGRGIGFRVVYYLERVGVTKKKKFEVGGNNNLSILQRIGPQSIQRYQVTSNERKKVGRNEERLQSRNAG